MELQRPRGYMRPLGVRAAVRGALHIARFSAQWGLPTAPMLSWGCTDPPLPRGRACVAGAAPVARRVARRRRGRQGVCGDRRAAPPAGRSRRQRQCGHAAARAGLRRRRRAGRPAAARAAAAPQPAEHPHRRGHGAAAGGGSAPGGGGRPAALGGGGGGRRGAGARAGAGGRTAREGAAGGWGTAEWGSKAAFAAGARRPFHALCGGHMGRHRPRLARRSRWGRDSKAASAGLPRPPSPARVPGSPGPSPRRRRPAFRKNPPAAPALLRRASQTPGASCRAACPRACRRRRGGRWGST
jgi:hypothetical protein